MTKVAVLGAGLVGRTIAEDLSMGFSVTAFDRDQASLDRIRNREVKRICADLSRTDTFAGLLADFSIVVNAVPGFMGYATLEALISCGKNVADISFFPEDALALDALAKSKRVTVITDCGVAPGLSNYVLGYENENFSVRSFECMVGGLPKKRLQPFEYKAPFSPVDVIEEYTRPARYVENGHLVTKPALSDAELLNFEKAGTLEAFNTDGLRSIISTMSHIPDMKEKTLRYPGHIGLMQALMRGGFFNQKEILVKGTRIKPFDVTTSILFDQWKPGENEAEFTIMTIVLKGEKNGEPYAVEYFLYDEFDAASSTPSMSRTTGYTCNATVNLIAGNHFSEKGVFPPELVGSHKNCFDFVLHYLRERNVAIVKKELLPNTQQI